MKNSQLIEIVGFLSKKQVRELRKWLCSPAHNHRADVTDLFSYLVSHIDKADDKYYEKERIYKKIYPKEAYDDAKMRQLMHMLQKNIERYLLYTLQDENDISLNLKLARPYRYHNLDKSYRRLVKNLEKEGNSEKIQDEFYYRDKFLLMEERFSYLGETRPKEADLQDVVDNLEISFIISKLRFACHMLSHQNSVKKVYNFGMLDSTIKYVEENDLVTIPAIKIYFYLYLTQKFPEEESHYYKYKQTIFEYSDILPHSQMRDNYLLGLNYCIRKVNKGKPEFHREGFEVYRQGISNKVLFTDGGNLSFSTFRNIVNIGTIVKEFDWIKRFIVDYQEYLPLKQKEETVLYSEGKYYFEKGEYEKARDKFLFVNPSNVRLNLMIKSMLIRIYYHIDEFQLLEALVESTKVYINRKEDLGTQYKRGFMNFVKFSKKLVRVNPFDAKAKAKLKEGIQEVRPLIAKDWFLEQVDNL